MNELIGELPKLEDGCVIKSWRCNNPTREEMKNDPETYNIQCKLCTTCNMIYCKYHMSHGDHWSHCAARLQQEKVELKGMQDRLADEVKEKDAEQKDKIIFEEAKREAIKNHGQSGV